jgi:Zn-dependent peptidase ImmA (M78 family)
VRAQTTGAITHEIGHWVCHCPEERAPVLEPSYCRASDIANDADRAVEREANIFASELLMPEDAVRSAWEEIGEVESVAARLDVSPLAIGWRLFNLGLVEAKPA